MLGAEGELGGARRRLAGPERLLFVLDACPEMLSVFDAVGGRTRLEVALDLVLAVARRKASSTAMRHSFALAAVSEQGALTMLSDFSTSAEDVASGAATLRQRAGAIDLSGEEEALDLFPLLSQVRSRFDRFGAETTCRCVLVFGRSFQPPVASSDLSALARENLFVDILYLHHRREEPGARLQEVFDALLCAHEALAAGKNAFVFESNFSAMKLLSFACALMAHAEQRDSQAEFAEKMAVASHVFSLT